jgi:AraC family transcriptional regulator of adaptative response/methylated-DNA-[protein]-cysteine methyltransferase
MIQAMDAAAQWSAVLARDAAFDGRFVYAVRTTGVYCRPSCPSRRPARPNVAFYAGPDAAERDGFRPCRRCRPRAPRYGAEALAARACALLDARVGADDPRITLAALADELGVSAFHLQRTFTRVMGVSPRAYLEARRVGRLRRALGDAASVTAAAQDAGFASSSRLYERTGAHLGMTPTAYRRGGEGVRVRYGLAACALGRLLVAVTDRGVCAVRIGEDDEALVDELRRELPRASLERDEQTTQPWVEAVAALASGRPPGRSLPLDVRATAFQRRVWQALQRIPAGVTRSYGEIAAALGLPGGARAVARACASNPVALVVPCHRVVRGDGSLADYRWGRWRKEKLLQVEAQELTPAAEERTPRPPRSPAPVRRARG